MAAKRPPPDLGNDAQPSGKRLKTFASVVGEATRARSFQSFVNMFEPLLRRVVQEEVERGIQRTMRTMTRKPSLRIQARQPACMELMFANKDLPTIFTCNKISDVNGEPLKLVVVEKIGDQITQKILPHHVKVEIVVINGDFPSTDGDVWTAEEFNQSIIKERSGRRPLIAKDTNYTLRRGCCVTLSELEFTDNSSWTRSRKFKLGARVISDASNGGRILEALTEAFIVKDQRGEVYKKHYPPKLEDEVWRLVKIGKDGKFHKRLEQAGIKTVQDYLKLSAIDPTILKKILGGKAGITDRMWDSIMKHAKTCDVGNKLYICRGPSYTITFDATCNVVSFSNIDGESYSTPDFRSLVKNETINELVKNAYENWDSLQEVDRPMPINESLEQFQGNVVDHQQCAIPYEVGLDGGDAMNDNIEYGIWAASPQLLL